MSNRRRIKHTGNGAPIPLRPLQPREEASERPGGSAVLEHNCPDVGAVNGYRCDACKKYILVIHVDKGVTPMFLGCRATPDCGGRSVSLGYPSAEMPESLREKIQWEWYRPGKIEFSKMNAEMKDYIQRGGLALRRR